MNVIESNILNVCFQNYNHLLIAQATSKITVMKYLPPARPKLVPNLKTLRIY